MIAYIFLTDITLELDSKVELFETDYTRSKHLSCLTLRFLNSKCAHKDAPSVPHWLVINVFLLNMISLPTEVE